MEIGLDQHAEVEELIDPQVWQLLDIHQDLQASRARRHKKK